jgi:aryl-alcohol dehydrogenase-like predicted oxidoreductase
VRHASITFPFLRLSSREESKSKFQFVRELGIGIVAYSPLARGFFSVGIKAVENLSNDDYRKVCTSAEFSYARRFFSVGI